MVGSSGSGKTHLARVLARRLGREHIEIDRLHWGEGWSRRPDFREKVEALVGREQWVIEGNYRRRRFREMFQSDACKHLAVFEARRPRDLDAIFRE